MGYVFTGPKPAIIDGVERKYGDELPDSIRNIRHLQQMVSRGIVTWYPDPRPVPGDSEVPGESEEPVAIVAQVQPPSASATTKSPGPRGTRKRAPVGS